MTEHVLNSIALRSFSSSLVRSFHLKVSSADGENLSTLSDDQNDTIVSRYIFIRNFDNFVSSSLLIKRQLTITITIKLLNA